MPFAATVFDVTQEFSLAARRFISKWQRLPRILGALFSHIGLCRAIILIPEACNNILDFTLLIGAISRAAPRFGCIIEVRIKMPSTRNLIPNKFLIRA